MVQVALGRYIGLACLLVVASVAAHNLPGLVTQKSIRRAQEECVQYLRIPPARLAVYNEYIYPQDDETKCMVRCMGLNLGWWNDTEGIEDAAIRAYFLPDKDDCQYEQRTYHCLKSQRLGTYTTQGLDPCHRAFESYRCYYEQYGNIVVTPQFVPLSPLRLLAVMDDCASMLQLSDSECAREGTSESQQCVHERGCFIRCVFLRSGLYSEQHGPNLDRLFVQCGNYTDETHFRETTMCCYRQLKAECLDECDLMYRFFHECFPEGGGVGSNLASGVPVITASIEFVSALLKLISTLIPPS